MRRLLTSVLILGPLFLAANSEAISTTIVISEFRTRGPNGANDEFVEIFNKSSAPVTISGWRLWMSDGAGNTTLLRQVGAGRVLQPRQFLLFANNGIQGFSGNTNPPDTAPNLTYAQGIPDDGGIAILNSAGVVIDAVGMSAGSAYLEGTALAPLSANVNQSYERRNGGCSATVDTDDNATDFRFNQSQSFPNNLLTDCNSCVGVACTSPPNTQCWLAAGTCSSGTCTYTPRAAAARCQDGNACTNPDRCDGAGTCVSGAAVTCNNPPAAFCSDPQTLVTYEAAGTCAPVGGCVYDTLEPANCPFGCNGTTRACNPNPCTNVSCTTPPSNGCYDSPGTCSGGTCTYTTRPAGTSCSDGTMCTTGDVCDASGGCIPGAATDPDDGNPCTTDACNPANGNVTHTDVANGTDCDDGDLCNGLAACQAGTCNNGTPVACDTPPTGGCYAATGTCNPANGACTYAPLPGATACSDGDLCTTADECDGNGLCNGSAVPCPPPPPDCATPNTSREFSGGSCEPNGSCAFTETDTPCPFGCDSASGLCNSDPCIGVVCDTPPSQCHLSPGNCSGAGQCSYNVDEGGACDDADPCTSADECSAAGACSGTPLICNTAPLPTCVGNVSRHYGGASGSCVAGVCDYGTPVDDTCAFGCDGVTGLCANDPCGGVTCDQPPSQCHLPIGDCSGGICTYSLKPGGSTCDDADPCTDTDVCADTGECAGAPKTCNTPPPAECVAGASRTYPAQGTCNPLGTNPDLCDYPADVPDTACPNGCNAGTGLCNGDPCATTVCASPPGACFVDTGDCAGGTCTYPPRAQGIPCDDADPCTASDVCDGAGVCAGAADPTCGDAGAGGATGTDAGAGGTGPDAGAGGAATGPDGSTPPDGATSPDGSVSSGGAATGTGGSAASTGGRASGTGGRTGGSGGGGTDLDGGPEGDGGVAKSKDDGGCGCSVPRSSGNAPGSLALAAIALLAARRRRSVSR